MFAGVQLEELPQPRLEPRFKSWQKMALQLTTDGRIVNFWEKKVVVSMRRIDVAKEIAVKHGWLSEAPKPLQDLILSKVHYRSYEAGAVIYSAGDPPGGMYCVISGNLRVSIVPGERGPYMAHFFHPGTWTGEGPLVTGKTRLIGLSTLRPSELLYLPLPALHQIIKQDPSFWRYLAYMVIEQRQLAVGAADDLMIRDQTRRFVAILLRLTGSRYESLHEGPYQIDVSQTELARMANVSRTTIITILRKLEAGELIRLAYRRMEILAPDKLRAMLTTRV